MAQKNYRYHGKPLLRLLECYVLWTIDELSDADVDTLNEMTPKLQGIYRKEGRWHEIIAGVMKFPADMPSIIRGEWEQALSQRGQADSSIAAQQFAEIFVDQHMTS